MKPALTAKFGYYNVQDYKQLKQHFYGTEGMKTEPNFFSVNRMQNLTDSSLRRPTQQLKKHHAPHGTRDVDR
jgi:hypothetical protein